MKPKWGTMLRTTADMESAAVEYMRMNARECGAEYFTVFRNGEYVGWVSPPEALLEELPEAKVISHG